MCSGCNVQQPSAGLVNEQWLAHIGDLGYRAFEVERLGQHNLEDLSAVRLESARNNRDRRTFCTLMLWLVLLKISAARIAFAKRRA
jgi:hypothetical protein